MKNFSNNALFQEHRKVQWKDAVILICRTPAWNWLEYNFCDRNRSLMFWKKIYTLNACVFTCVLQRNLKVKINWISAIMPALQQLLNGCMCNTDTLSADKAAKFRIWRWILSRNQQSLHLRRQLHNQMCLWFIDIFVTKLLQIRWFSSKKSCWLCVVPWGPATFILDNQHKAAMSSEPIAFRSI